MLGFSSSDWAALFDNLRDGVCIIKDYRISYASREIKKIYGECVGRECYRVFAGRDEPCHYCPLNNHGGSTLEVEIQSPEDRSYLVKYSTVNLKGSKVAVQTFLDVTERKKREETLRREVERVKDELIANVSHELRTPITIAKGAIELAMEEEDKNKRNRLLRVGRNALIRQNDIIGDLITVAKIESPDFKLKKEPVNLEDIISAALQEHEEIARRKKVRINAFVEELPLLKGDPAKLSRAISNLISNAVKFNKKGGDVIIRAGVENGGVTIAIADTGIGIAKEFLDRIFERFYQVDGSIMRRYSGTGMGLTVAKKIIEAHGGRITAESEVDKGSRFIITLPLEVEV